MASDQVRARVAERIAAEESRILRSVSWISVATAILYLCGVAWRSFYYRRLGVPSVLIEFPFPGLLIPCHTPLAFIATATVAFLGARFYSFYQQQRRVERAKIMNVGGPLDMLAKYALKKSINPLYKGKTNHHVLHTLLLEYVERNHTADPAWVFDVKEFEKQAKPCFPDLPTEIEGSFVVYECKLVTMESGDIKETLVDSLCSWPQGSRFLDILSRWAAWIGLAFSLPCVISWPAYYLRMLAFIVLGLIVGRFLATLMDYEDRYQFWWMVWVSVVLLVFLNAVDGYETAGGQLSQGSLPSATIEQCDGMTYEGLLLADFSDGYVLLLLTRTICGNVSNCTSSRSSQSNLGQWVGFATLLGAWRTRA